MKSFLISQKQKLDSARAIVKAEGFRALSKRLGKKAVIAIVIYYLVRDITLYILIPRLLLK